MNSTRFTGIKITTGTLRKLTSDGNVLVKMCKDKE